MNLATRTVSGGDAQGDVISGFEDVIGSRHHDRITGSEGVNRIVGGGGADTLDGGAGRDVLDYSASPAGVRVNLATGETSRGHAQGDSIGGFEAVIGTAYDDHLVGDAQANRLVGGAGDDWHRGRCGVRTPSPAARVGTCSTTPPRARA